MDTADPQQINGYSYANNNPVTQSDPSGLRPIGLCEGYGGCGGKAESEGDEKTTEWFTSSGNGTWTQHTMKREADHSDDASIVWSYTYTQGAEKTVRYETYKHGKTVPFKAPEGEHYLWSKLKSAAKFLIFDPQDCAELVSWSCAAGVASLIPAAKLAKLMKLKRLEKAADDLPTQCLVKHSFVPGTDVLLADGTKKNIEDVELGDKVVATDPETGKTSIREVVGTISTEDDKEFVDLTITTKDGDAALISTTTHPFWVESEDEWIDAGSLEPGMILRTPDGATAQLKDARHFQKRQRTHDLTITDVHTYYVLAGATPVLVHNSSCPRFIADSSGNVVELPQVKSSISSQKQGRHILGGRGYKGGGYFNSQEDAQAVLDAYHSGAAQVMGITKTGNIQIRVPSVVGYDNNPAMNRLGVPTNIFMIKGTKSPSVVPMNPQAGAP